MSNRSLLALLLLLAMRANAIWGPPCYVTAYEEHNFGRVSSIARCAWTTAGVTNYSVKLRETHYLNPGNQMTVCEAWGYCGTVLHVSPYSASTVYTAQGNWEATQPPFPPFATTTLIYQYTTAPPDRWTSDDGNCFTRECTQDGCPLMINIGGGAWNLTDIAGGVAFDLDADGVLDRVSWPANGSDLAFVALDLNGNGRVDDGAELFGQYTGPGFANGFEALREYDRNADGVIDASDAIWRSLLLWLDANHDGVSAPGEMHQAASLISALGLSYSWSGRRDENGNMFRYRSAVSTGGASDPYYDVFLRFRRY